jgi:UDP-N-acetylmuramoyl-tripeptide--D-alanyl-D-alanine ligase
MEFWDLDSIKSVVGGTWLARPEHGGRAEGVATDSRSVKPGQCFVALRGEKFDGNSFISQAAGAGAALAMIDRPEALPATLAPGMAVLSVADSGLALLRLAGAYRRSLEGTRVVGVTGSNGKTTTTRLIESVLSQTLRGTASIKSFNNRVGVPLTILSAKRGDQFLVSEVGTNALGEIAELAAVLEPDIAVVTSIGREHLEGLKSVEGSVSEAVSLVAAVRAGGVVVINDEPTILGEAVTALSGANRSKGLKIVRFGRGEGSDLRLTSVEPDAEGVTFVLNRRQKYRVPLLGSHNALNAAAAIAVGRRLGVSYEAIQAGLLAVAKPEMRLERVVVAGVEIINDAYNANPESVVATRATFAELPAPGAGGRRIVVLGDMLELGSAGPDAHREIGDEVASRGFDLAIFIGPLSLFAAERVRRTWPGERVLPLDPLDAASAAGVSALFRAGDRVLLKGSRGMGLERIVTALRERGATPQVTVKESAKSLHTG